MIRISKLSYAFGRRSLIRDLSFDIVPQQLRLLTGDNGRGKTTLMSLIVGLRDLQHGNIHLLNNQQRFATASSQYRKAICYLGADHNGHFLELDATSNLHFWSQLQGINLSKTAITSALEEWGIDRSVVLSKLAVARFSTGMKKRLALARTQLSQAPFWFLDEPLHGLDISGIATFKEALVHHLNQGGSACMITHDLSPFKTIDYVQLDTTEYLPKESSQ